MEVGKGNKVVVIACITLLAAFCPMPCISAPAFNTATVIPGIPLLPDLQFSQIPAGKLSNYEGDRFSYMAAGPKDAPVVLLLHGVGANSMHWRFQYPVLGERYRVIAWNAPGYILSDYLKADAPTCEDYADAVNDFLTSLGIEKVYLVGNSFGSLAGQCFAARYPQKVIKAVFTGTIIGEGWRPEEQKKAVLEGRKKQIQAGGYTYGSGRVSAIVGKNTSEEKLTLMRSVLRATNPRAFMQVIYFALNTDSRPLAPKLTMPILMIQGTEDQAAPAKEHSYVLKPLLPNAKLQEVPGVGHLPEFEVPDVFNKSALDFFAN
jgi:pimeloyl-ACP methyl ester carboxylesterase